MNDEEKFAEIERGFVKLLMENKLEIISNYSGLIHRLRHITLKEMAFRYKRDSDRQRMNEVTTCKKMWEASK
jgi:hypothetical protein